MFLFNPLVAAAIGAALENDRKIKELQRRGTEPEFRLTGRASQRDPAVLQSRIAEAKEKQIQLMNDIRRNRDEMLKRQIEHQEEILRRLEFESKLELYSSQFISEGFSPIEADEMARDEIFYEEELLAVSEIAKDLTGQLNLPMAAKNIELAITKASRNSDSNNIDEQILNLYPSDGVKSAIRYLLDIVTKAHTPKFNAGLLEHVKSDCYKIICNHLEAGFKAWHQDVVAQTTTRITWCENASKKKLLSLEYLISFNEELIKRIKPKLNLLHQVLEIASLAQSLNPGGKFRPIPDMGAWTTVNSASEIQITPANVMDFISCALAGSENHWESLKQSVQFVKGKESNALGLMLCSVKFSSSESILLALDTNTKNATLKRALELFIQDQLTVKAPYKIVNLTTNEKQLLAIFVEMKLDTDDAEETVRLFNLLSNLSDTKNFGQIIERIATRIMIFFRKEDPAIRELISNRLQMNLDANSLKLLLRTASPGDTNNILEKFQELNAIDDGDIAWLLAETYRAIGQSDIATNFENRALNLQSIDAYLARARVAVRKADTSQLKVLNAFTNSIKKDKRTSEIEGAKFYLRAINKLKSGEYCQAEQDFERAKNLGVQQAKRQIEILREESQRKSTKRTKWRFKKQ